MVVVVCVCVVGGGIMKYCMKNQKILLATSLLCPRRQEPEPPVLSSPLSG